MAPTRKSSSSFKRKEEEDNDDLPLIKMVKILRKKRKKEKKKKTLFVDLFEEEQERRLHCNLDSSSDDSSDEDSNYGCLDEPKKSSKTKKDDDDDKHGDDDYEDQEKSDKKMLASKLPGADGVDIASSPPPPPPAAAAEEPVVVVDDSNDQEKSISVEEDIIDLTGDETAEVSPARSPTNHVATPSPKPKSKQYRNRGGGRRGGRGRGRGRGRPCTVYQFSVEMEYVHEVQRRAKLECKALLASTQKDGGVCTYGAKKVCHVCHGKRNHCVFFPCGRTGHIFCDNHCLARLGFYATDAIIKPVPLDYCPICCLTCPCPKCCRRLDAVATEFKQACVDQGKSLKEIEQMVMENVLQLCASTTKRRNDKSKCVAAAAAAAGGTGTNDTCNSDRKEDGNDNSANETNIASKSDGNARVNHVPDENDNVDSIEGHGDEDKKESKMPSIPTLSGNKTSADADLAPMEKGDISKDVTQNNDSDNNTPQKPEGEKVVMEEAADENMTLEAITHEGDLVRVLVRDSDGFGTTEDPEKNGCKIDISETRTSISSGQNSTEDSDTALPAVMAVADAISKDVSIDSSDQPRLESVENSIDSTENDIGTTSTQTDFLSQEASQKDGENAVLTDSVVGVSVDDADKLVDASSSDHIVRINSCQNDDHGSPKEVSTGINGVSSQKDSEGSESNRNVVKDSNGEFAKGNCTSEIETADGASKMNGDNHTKDETVSKQTLPHANGQHLQDDEKGRCLSVYSKKDDCMFGKTKDDDANYVIHHTSLENGTGDDYVHNNDDADSGSVTVSPVKNNKDRDDKVKKSYDTTSPPFESTAAAKNTSTDVNTPLMESESSSLDNSQNNINSNCSQKPGEEKVDFKVDCGNMVNDIALEVRAKDQEPKNDGERFCSTKEFVENDCKIGIDKTSTLASNLSGQNSTDGVDIAPPAVLAVEVAISKEVSKESSDQPKPENAQERIDSLGSDKDGLGTTSIWAVPLLKEISQKDDSTNSVVTERLDVANKILDSSLQNVVACDINSYKNDDASSKDIFSISCGKEMPKGRECSGSKEDIGNDGCNLDRENAGNAIQVNGISKEASPCYVVKEAQRFEKGDLAEENAKDGFKVNAERVKDAVEKKGRAFEGVDAGTILNDDNKHNNDCVEEFESNHRKADGERTDDTIEMRDESFKDVAISRDDDTDDAAACRGLDTLPLNDEEYDENDERKKGMLLSPPFENLSINNTSVNAVTPSMDTDDAGINVTEGFSAFSEDDLEQNASSDQNVVEGEDSSEQHITNCFKAENANRIQGAELNYATGRNYNKNVDDVIEDDSDSISSDDGDDGDEEYEDKDGVSSSSSYELDVDNDDEEEISISPLCREKSDGPPKEAPPQTSHSSTPPAPFKSLAKRKSKRHIKVQLPSTPCLKKERSKILSKATPTSSCKDPPPFISLAKRRKRRQLRRTFKVTQMEQGLTSNPSKRIGENSKTKQKCADVKNKKKKDNNSQNASSCESLPASILSEHPPPIRKNRPGRKSLTRSISTIDPKTTQPPKGLACSKPLHYYETLGKCHMKKGTFMWCPGSQTRLNRERFPAKKDIVRYNKHLGRVYYPSFRLHGTTYRVGDFVERVFEGESQVELCRIVGAYQATKSFLGVWSKETPEEIQKRGCAYILVAPLFLKSEVLPNEEQNNMEKMTLHKRKPSTSISHSKKRRRSNTGGYSTVSADKWGGKEVLLGADHKYCPLHIEMRPQWLNEDGVSYRKISVRIVDADGIAWYSCGKRIPEERAVTSKSTNVYVCRGALTRSHTLVSHRNATGNPLVQSLSDFQMSLLKGSADTLVLKHIPMKWSAILRSQQVQFVHNNRHWSDDDASDEEDAVQYQYTLYSSDDSDGFDTESQRHLEDDDSGDDSSEGGIATEKTRQKREITGKSSSQSETSSVTGSSISFGCASNKNTTTSSIRKGDSSKLDVENSDTICSSDGSEKEELPMETNGSSLSEYEKKRERNILRNKARLSALGLSELSLSNQMDKYTVQDPRSKTQKGENVNYTATSISENSRTQWQLRRSTEEKRKQRLQKNEEQNTCTKKQKERKSIEGNSPCVCPVIAFLSEHLPPVRKQDQYPCKKSLKRSISTIDPKTLRISKETSISKPLHYYETLGKCHMKRGSFVWCPGSQTRSNHDPFPAQRDIVGYNERLGRVYYPSFQLHGTTYRVGDFVEKRTEGESQVELFRIVGAYQATKSFLGVWIKQGVQATRKKGRHKSKPTEEIQKRGQAYILVAPLFLKSEVLSYGEHHYPHEDEPLKRKSSTVHCSDQKNTSSVSRSGKKRKTNDGGCFDVANDDREGREVVLGADYKFSPRHIDMLPQWLDDDKLTFTKACVRIVGGDGTFQSTHESTIKKPRSTRQVCGQTQNAMNHYICCEATTRNHTSVVPKKDSGKPLLQSLTHSHVSLLTSSAEELLVNHIPYEWSPEFNHKQIQFVREHRYFCDEEDDNNTSDEEDNGTSEGEDSVGYQYTLYSSDDSDGFDEESTRLLENNGSTEKGGAVNCYRIDGGIVMERPHRKGEIMKKAKSTRECKEQWIRETYRCPDYEDILVHLVTEGDFFHGSKDELSSDVPTNTDITQNAIDTISQLSHDIPSLGPLLRQANEHLSTEFLRVMPLEQRFNVQSADHIGQIKQQESMYWKLANDLRVFLGYPEFRTPQGDVCVAAMAPRSDVVYLAPTGHGKSLCFVIPAVAMRGITLVVEPLRGIIADQVKKLNLAGKVRAEKLLSVDDIEDGFKGIRAEQRLTQIANEIYKDNNSYDEALILFATPELTVQTKVLAQLARINNAGKLMRFVIDEFDVAAERTRDYRSSYEGILQKLRETCQNVPFSCFSATTKRKDLLDFLSGLKLNPHNLPKLFIHERPLRDNLIFGVERKEKEAQVIERIVYILNFYHAETKKKVQEERKKKRVKLSKPKCICYCLTRGNCHSVANSLTEYGITSEAVTSGNRQHVNECVKRLRSGDTQVLCATKVIGRGVDVNDIRFVFHFCAPVSLSDYVQETGRAGRDGIPSYCILFYRPHDRTQAEKVVRLTPADCSLDYNSISDEEKEKLCLLTGEKRLQAERALDEVRNYSTMSSECRYSMLASYATLRDFVSKTHRCSETARCDNCRVNFGLEGSVFSIAEEKRSVTLASGHQAKLRLCDVDITTFVYEFLKKLHQENTCQTTSGISRKTINDLFTSLVDKFISSNPKEPMEIAELSAMRSLRSGPFKSSLRCDIIRLLMGHKIINRIYSQKYVVERSIDSFINQLELRKVKISLRNVRSFQDKSKGENNSRAIADSSVAAFAHDEHLKNAEVAQSAHQLSVEKPLCPKLTYGPKDRQAPQSMQIHRKLKENFHKNVDGTGFPRLRMTKDAGSWLPFLPFLLQFEIWRLYNITGKGPKLTCDHMENEMYRLFNNELFDENDHHNTLLKIHNIAKTRHSFQRYEKIVKGASSSRLPVDKYSGEQMFGCGSALYFSATLDSRTKKLTLNPPEQASDRRIFRKFGSHRFLHLNISKDIWKGDVMNIIDRKNDDPLWICGRRYGFLWCKATKSPQCYVLFAEAGIGIKREEEITTHMVREWCAPRKFNSDLSVGKEQKRIKLSFSKTTPSGVLPPNCLEVVSDIRPAEGGMAMTDGSGLISRDGLDFVWHSYTKYNQAREAEYANQSEINPNLSTPSDETIDGNLNDCDVDQINDDESPENNCCPYTSFQCRIGGFKGMMILDERLGDGIKVVCRDSQKKVNFPMRSLISFSEECKENGIRCEDSDFDEMYDTIDVCSWDKHPKEGRLSLRTIQILEHRGVDIEFFKKCADDGTKWLSRLYEDPNALLEHVSKIHSAMISKDAKTSYDMFDDDLLFRMASVKMDKSEPVYAQKILKLVKKDADSMRTKGKYPLRRCKQLRLIPDHTQLLEEGEAFIAVGYASGKPGIIKDIEKSQYVLAMRSPAYFGGDLVKLKLVSRRTLRLRAAQLKKEKTTPGISAACSMLNGPISDAYQFFQDLHTGLVISSRGDRSAADMMSGGDFDGDEAWVCWDEQLAQLVNDYPAQVTTTPEFIVHKTRQEKVLASTASLKQRAEFALHYRRHQTQLGKLSTNLDAVMDRFGVDSPESIVIGTQAFLQVDHPYKLCQIKQECNYLMDGSLESPHWLSETSKCRSYTSEKALGVLYDYMQSKINSVIAACTNNGNATTRLNPHIISIINLAKEKGLNDYSIRVHTSELQRKIRSALDDFYSDYKQFKATISDDEEDAVGVAMEWMKSQHREWRKKLIDCEEGEDAQNLASAILYEETWRKSMGTSFQGEHKMFAWHVAKDRLLRIIGDAVQRSTGAGVAPTLLREHERVLYQCGISNRR